jgi:hypothetical protein
MSMAILIASIWGRCDRQNIIFSTSKIKCGASGLPTITPGKFGYDDTIKSA